MSKKLDVSYSASNGERVTVGQFEIEVYTSVAKALDDIFCEVSGRIKQKGLKKICITIEQIEPENG